MVLADLLVVIKPGNEHVRALNICKHDLWRQSLAIVQHFWSFGFFGRINFNTFFCCNSLEVMNFFLFLQEKEKESWEASCDALKSKLEIAESNYLRAETEVAKMRSNLQSS